MIVMVINVSVDCNNSRIESVIQHNKMVATAFIIQEDERRREVDTTMMSTTTIDVPLEKHLVVTGSVLSRKHGSSCNPIIY